MKAKVFNTEEEFFASKEKGGIWHDGKGNIFFRCPGCVGIHGFRAVFHNNPPDIKPVWEMTGWPEHITVNPSIRVIPYSPESCNWHGWLQNGEWKSA